MARIVLTHSTYLEGLIKGLKRISCEEGIQTITPGVIGRCSGRSNSLTFRITRKTEKGYKLIARKGKSYQEVFLVTKLSMEEIEKLIRI